MKRGMTIIGILMMLSIYSTLVLFEGVFSQEKIPIILKLEKFVLDNGQEKDGKMLWNRSINERAYNVIILGKDSLLFGRIELGTPPIGFLFIGVSNLDGTTKYSYLMAAFHESDLSILEHKELSAEEFEGVAISFYRLIVNQDSIKI